MGVTAIVLNTLSSYRFYIEDWVSQYFIMHQGVRGVKFQDNVWAFTLQNLWKFVFMCKKCKKKEGIEENYIASFKTLKSRLIY